MKTKKIVSLLLALALVLAFVPATVFAGVIKDYTCDARDAVPYTMGSTVTLGGPSSWVAGEWQWYTAGNAWYKFTLTQSAEITMNAKAIPGGDEPNEIKVAISTKDANHHVYSTGGDVARIDVVSNAAANKTYRYKVLPGNYLLEVSGENIYGSFTLTKKDMPYSASVIKANATAFSLNTSYSNNIINYQGNDKNGDLMWGGLLYHKFTAPSAGKYKIAFSRNDTDRDNSMSLQVVDSGGYYFGDSIDIATIPKGSGTVNLPKAGTYYLQIESSSCLPSEYTFRVDALTVLPTKVTLNKTALTLQVKKTFTLKATVAPSNATNKTVTWTTSNKKVATVTAKGVVKAIGKGTATITVKTANGKKATCKITVK
jgi:uncharacterized protein YjdB